MKVTNFEVVGLLGRPGTMTADLNDDLNILTGRNGVGKTTLLKLLWYVMSGNISLALQEVPFSRCRLTTDLYACTVHRLSSSNCKVEFDSNGVQETFEDFIDPDGDFVRSAEEEANSELISRGGSVFFSTFRRLEGGFSIISKRSRGARTAGSPPTFRNKLNDIEEALSDLSRKLSNGKHTFVSAISTSDIVGILLRRYADYSEEYNGIQQSTSNEIISTIKDYKSVKSDDLQGVKSAERLLDVIRNRIESMESQREKIMAPIEAVRTIVERLIKHTGISIDTRLSFGDAASAVNSDLLSAGEKQMLSFICYNAFFRNSVFLIDEPELSLHVDWQRQLFPILLSQKSSNQFIVATHSPFIYSKYPDKEITIDLDKGDSEGVL
jgi:predicted ATP-binding protein involved in virulence